VLTRLDMARIRAARRVIDPVFLDTPLYRCEALEPGLGCAVSIKLETANPVRSFKSPRHRGRREPARRPWLASGGVRQRGQPWPGPGLVRSRPGAGGHRRGIALCAGGQDRDRFAGRHVVTIVCGSNVDADAYRRWVGSAPAHRS